MSQAVLPFTYESKINAPTSKQNTVYMNCVITRDIFTNGKLILKEGTKIVSMGCEVIFYTWSEKDTDYEEKTFIL